MAEATTSLHSDNESEPWCLNIDMRLCPIGMPDSQLIGSGSAACVYGIDQDLVLKAAQVFMRPEEGASSETFYEYARETLERQELMKREQRIYRRLQEQQLHPNIAEAIELYPEGTYMRKYVPLTAVTQTVDRVRIYRDILKALVHLHNMNISHSDLQAWNVLLDARGQAILCDFSEARDFGTPQDLYADKNVMLPRGGPAEQLSDATDRFAMASLIYELEKGMEKNDMMDRMVRFYPNENWQTELPEICLGDPGLDSIVRKGWTGLYESTAEMLGEIEALEPHSDNKQTKATSVKQIVPVEELKERVRVWRDSRLEQWGKSAFETPTEDELREFRAIVSDMDNPIEEDEDPKSVQTYVAESWWYLGILVCVALVLGQRVLKSRR